MVDNFALLNQPRRPWLDPEEIQARFVALSGELHPDRVHHLSAEERAIAHQRFTALNEACRCLREPRQRLRHLLELERGSLPPGTERLPSAGADFYFDLGQLCRQVDQFLGERSKVQSPLLKVRLFEEAMSWRTKLEKAQEELKGRLLGLEQALRDLNPIWDAAALKSVGERGQVLPLERLEQLYRESSFVGRWLDQVGERMVQLSF